MAAAHKPTQKSRAEVMALASYGIPQTGICEYIGIKDKKTLHKHYRKELDRAAVNANAKVGKFLFKAASGDALEDENIDAKFADCIRAAIFWAKTRMDWSERSEITGPGGGPVEVKVTRKVVDPGENRS